MRSSLALVAALLATLAAPARATTDTPRLVAETLWTVPLESAPRDAPRSVLIGGEGGRTLVAVLLMGALETRSLETGEVVWRLGSLGEPWLQAGDAVTSADRGELLAVADQHGGDGRVQIVDAGDGTVLEQIPLAGRPSGPPRALGPTAVEGWAVPLEDGAILVVALGGERRRLAPTPPARPPLLTIEGRLAAFSEGDENDAAQVLPLFGSRAPTGRWDALLTTTAIARDSWVFAATGGAGVVGVRCHVRGNERLRCRERWTQALAGRVTAAPTLVGNQLFVPSWDSFVYAFRADNGHLLWRTPTGARVARSLLVWDEWLVALAEDAASFTFLDRMTGAPAGKITGASAEVATTAPARVGDALVVPVLTPPAVVPVLRAWRVRMEAGGGDGRASTASRRQP